MLINITIQTFTSQNELELSVSRWDEIKHEYRDQKSMEDCLPIWGAIEQRWREKITNKTLSYRGIQIDCLHPSDQ
jgi:hypothetical protein